MLAVPLDQVADFGSFLMRADHDSAVIAGFGATPPEVAVGPTLTADPDLALTVAANAGALGICYLVVL